MKDKKILYVLVILIVLIVGFLIFKYFKLYYLSDDNNTVNEIDTIDTDNIDDNTIIFSNEKHEVSADSQLNKMFGKLYEYGNEIYAKNEYSSYNKKSDIYFLSLNEINNKYSYDISMFVGDDGTVCNKDSSGIYFDIESKISSDVGVIVPVLVECCKLEQQSNQ